MCYSAEESTAPGRCAGLPCARVHTNTDTNTHACIEKMLLDDEPDQRNSFVSSYRTAAIQLFNFTNVITFLSLVSENVSQIVYFFLIPSVFEG